MWQLQKVADEGTGEPYIARFWAGMLELRDLVLRHRSAGDQEFEQRRKHFDDRYSPVLDALGAARKHSAAIQALVSTHKQKVSEGTIISRQRNALQINETINIELQEQVSAFLSAAARAAKLSQDLLTYLDLNVGFLFQKDSKFAAGVERLRAEGQSQLADYLQATRLTWSNTLLERRHALEHKGWRLPDLRYIDQPNGVVLAVEPDVDGRPVSEYVATMLDRLLVFVEDMLVLAVQRGIADIGDLIDIPKESRTPAEFRRFRFGLPALQPNEPFWRLGYDSRPFNDR